MANYPEDGYVRRAYLLDALEQQLNKVPNNSTSLRDNSAMLQQFGVAKHELRTRIGSQLGEPLKTRDEIDEAVRQIAELGKDCLSIALTHIHYSLRLLRAIDAWRDRTLELESIL